MNKNIFLGAVISLGLITGCYSSPRQHVDVVTINSHIENVKVGLGYEDAQRIALQGIYSKESRIRARAIDLYRALVKKNRCRIQAFGIVEMFQNSIYSEESLAATRLFLALSEENT